MCVETSLYEYFRHEKTASVVLAVVNRETLRNEGKMFCTNSFPSM